MTTFATLIFAFSRESGIVRFIRQQTDTTFKGKYVVNGFDLAILIPYFIVLIFLASYGVHRYVLVYLYY